MNARKIWLFIRLSRPHFILGAALLYALGAGIVRYLGTPIDWGLYFLGLVWVTFIQLSTHYLNEYFDSPVDVENEHRTPFSGGSGTIGKEKLSRETALYAGVICLALAAYFTLVIIRSAQVNAALVITLVLIFLGAFFYSIPPVRLSSTGYGELVTSIIVSNLVPALAFLLQNNELHRLLAMATFPLTMLNLAIMLAFELPDFASDLKYHKTNLMVRIGWQRGILFHNVSILIAYVLFGVGAILGFPLRIVLPAFLTLPLGLFEIWLINRIADGAKPNWFALTFTAASLYGVTAYLLTFAFWTR
jgi:1,4-dihydroxy-2-naphthoate polyprenyltransferase